jgi:putative endonuclease
MWYVYILKCKDGKLYTGITTDLDRRVSEHNAGKGGQFTRGRTPVKMVYSEKAKDRSFASKREIEIKRLTRSEKMNVIM